MSTLVLEVTSNYLPTSASVIALLCIGFILAFLLAFSVGANDVANSFATAVGSHIITIKQAFIIASIFELLGAVLIGAKVSDTIRNGIVDPNTVSRYYINSTNCFYPIPANLSKEMIKNMTYEKLQSNVVKLSCDSMVEMIGATAALGGAAFWLMMANIFSLPVSGTHSIIGAVLGYGIAALSGRGIQWLELLKIVASWFISPLLSGFFSSSIYWILNRFVLSSSDSYNIMEKLVPYLLFIVSFVNIFSIFLPKRSSQIAREKVKTFSITSSMPLYGTFILAFLVGSLSAIFYQIWYFKRFKRKTETTQPSNKRTEIQPESIISVQVDDDAIKDQDQPCHDSEETLGYKKSDSTESERPESLSSVVPLCASPPHVNGSSSFSSFRSQPEVFVKTPVIVQNDDPKTMKLFHSLQVVVSAFGAFSHGGNDVSNAVAPLITCWLVFKVGVSTISEKTGFPYFLLGFGGVAMVIGLLALGKRVIKTMGTELSEITPLSAFCIDLGSCLTVLFATVSSIPISSTHCKVGSVILVGIVRNGLSNINWGLFRNIALSWLVTVPISALASGILYLIMAALVFLI